MGRNNLEGVRKGRSTRTEMESEVSGFHPRCQVQDPHGLSDLMQDGGAQKLTIILNST